MSIGEHIQNVYFALYYTCNVWAMSCARHTWTQRYSDQVCQLDIRVDQSACFKRWRRRRAAVAAAAAALTSAEKEGGCAGESLFWKRCESVESLWFRRSSWWRGRKSLWSAAIVFTCLRGLRLSVPATSEPKRIAVDSVTCLLQWVCSVLWKGKRWSAALHQDLLVSVKPVL